MSLIKYPYRASAGNDKFVYEADYEREQEWLFQNSDLLDRTTENPPRTLPCQLMAIRHGATQEIAEAVGRTLNDRGVAAAVVPMADVTDLDGYDAVIVGSAVYKSNLGFGERAVMLAFRAVEGDYRDWSEIEAWASGISHDLRR